METYQLLRQIDYLKTSLDNLTRETFWFIPATTIGYGLEPELCDNSGEFLFRQQVKRIDGIAEILHEYTAKQAQAVEK
jgi:hypothetical protein